jgi:hypothetical protein
MQRCLQATVSHLTTGCAPRIEEIYDFPYVRFARYRIEVWETKKE